MKIGDEMGLEAEIRQLRTMLSARNHDIEAYRALCERAADALAFETLGRHSQIEIRDWSELIAELRKAV